MSKIVLAAALVAAFAFAACSSAPIEPRPSPSANPSNPPAQPSPSAPPTVTPPPSVAPPATPAPAKPTASPATAKPPAAVVLTRAERYLRDGALRDATNCVPVRDKLPGDAIAGIECASPARAVARVGFYLFANDDDMLEAYEARMIAEGVPFDSGSCAEGESEGAYMPGEEEIASRHGCFVNDAGFANYRYTIPGAHVYIGILGESADMVALENFAWKGSMDTPGNPTLWGMPS